MLSHPGELAALATAVCWTLSATAFEAAGKRVGSLALNFLRLVMALGLVAAWLAFAQGAPIPRELPPATVLWLAGSGLVGFVIGDLCLFRAFVLIGARVSLLIMALVPPITALLGWLLLGDALGPWGLVGMALTVGGVAWVVAERGRAGGDGAPAPRRYPLPGVLLAVGGALGQAVGLIMARHVMAGVYPFEASFVRIVAGVLGFAIVLAGARWWPRTVAALRDGRAMGLAWIGAFFGPFLGVAASLAAVRWTDAGTASTLMSIVPVLMIPMSVLVFREQVGLRAGLGSLVAVGGVACMFV
ncbi:MAG: DMT family transporter [Pseudomonadota bacterium]